VQVLEGAAISWGQVNVAKSRTGRRSLMQRGRDVSDIRMRAEVWQRLDGPLLSEIGPPNWVSLHVTFGV